MARDVLSDLQVVVNNVNIAVVPNTITYTEGFGESNVRVGSVGGGSTVLFTSNNIENRKSKVMFSIFPNAESIALARGWKVNGSANVIAISSNTENFTKTFTEAVLTNDFEVNVQSEGQIDLEFETRPAV